MYPDKHPVLTLPVYYLLTNNFIVFVKYNFIIPHDGNSGYNSRPSIIGICDVKITDI